MFLNCSTCFERHSAHHQELVLHTSVVAVVYDLETSRIGAPYIYDISSLRVNIGKVYLPLVQALRLCTFRTARRESRCIALPFYDDGTRRGCGVSVTPLPFFTSGKDLVPIVEGAGWAPGPVWTGAENLSPNRIRSPDSPGRSQSLYRLRYLAHANVNILSLNKYITFLIHFRYGSIPLFKLTLKFCT